MIVKELPFISKPQVPHDAASLPAELIAIIEGLRLTSVFQPIVSLARAEIIAYEGLIRGPASSPLYSPDRLFAEAERYHLSLALERSCQEVTLERFSGLHLSGLLFINLGPEALVDAGFHPGMLARQLEDLQISCEQIVIEITEGQTIRDMAKLSSAMTLYRRYGFRFALDDFGTGSSNFHLWSITRPEFVKLDKHFVRNIHEPESQKHFAQSVIDLAQKMGTVLIAEGVETCEELQVLQSLGVEYAQGFFFGKPSAMPMTALTPACQDVLNTIGNQLAGDRSHLDHSIEKCSETAGDLLMPVSTLAPDAATELAYQMFADDPDLFAIPVVEEGRAVGLLRRHDLLEKLARPFNRELYGKKPCALIMDTEPLMVDCHLDIQALSSLVVAAERRYLVDGFIIIENGRYLGMGTGYDLMKAVSDIQLQAARHANPLTGLPGNVPINDAIDQLLAEGENFVVAYCDLDFFKPFNDLYGFSRGDELIQLAGRLLISHADSVKDFVGHIGGDDFIVLFRCENWIERCQALLAEFETAVQQFFEPAHIEAGGYWMNSRTGERTFFPLTSISIGAVEVALGGYHSHRDLSSVAAEAKKQAKKIAGNSLFIERRHLRECVAG